MRRSSLKWMEEFLRCCSGLFTEEKSQKYHNLQVQRSGVEADAGRLLPKHRVDSVMCRLINLRFAWFSASLIDNFEMECFESKNNVQFSWNLIYRTLDEDDYYPTMLLSNGVQLGIGAAMWVAILLTVSFYKSIELKLDKTPYRRIDIRSKQIVFKNITCTSNMLTEILFRELPARGYPNQFWPICE